MASKKDATEPVAKKSARDKIEALGWAYSEGTPSPSARRRQDDGLILHLSSNDDEQLLQAILDTEAQYV